MAHQSHTRANPGLPQENETADDGPTCGVLSQSKLPLGGSRYHVVPDAVRDEALKQDGVTNATEIQATSPAKLRDSFGVDAVLYSEVTQYGHVCQLADTMARVAAPGHAVDLQRGHVVGQGEGRRAGQAVGHHTHVNGLRIGAPLGAASL
ncbi:GNA1162 family protein, partial [Burkholderia cenocepacia]|uniref:GNA1162 family protein n=1 Tax=Burkholderia cenocepacia TaxID=95486 RepID=UPI00406C8945